MWNRFSPRARAALVVVVLLAVAALAERGRWFSRLLGAGSPERIWIWVAASPREVRPRAFFVARDFDLAAPAEGARLEVAGDPEYVARINGFRIGSALYRSGSPIDVYVTGDALRAGRNRIWIELRTPIGSGGVTARVVDAGGRVLVATDGDWRIYEGAWRALANLDQPLPEAPRATVLGRAPYARWALPDEQARPAYLEQVAADALEPAKAWRQLGGAAEWQPVPRRRREPFGAAELVEIDFGREISGFLHLDVQPLEAAQGMLFFADEAGATLARSPDRVVVAVPGLGFWQDAEARRFRYVTLVGLPTLRAVSVIPLRVDVEGVPAQPETVRGLFGGAVEPTRSPMVEELRRRLLSEPAGGS